MTTLETIRARRSIRKYNPDIPVPREHITQILEAAMMAPSACNTRPWEFIVIESNDLKEKIMSIHRYTHMLKTAPVAIVVCGKPELQSGISEGYWPQDCAAATENMLLAAKDLGYGACWCGVYPTQRVSAFKELLGVESVPFSVVAIGVADEEPAARGFYDETRVTWL